MIPRPKELEWWPGPKIADKSLDLNQCSDVGLEFLGPAHEKAARRSVPPKTKKPVASQRIGLLPLFCIPIAVDRRETVPLFRQIFERKNSRHRTDRDTRAAVDAFRGMDIQLRFALEIRFILARMNAVHGADIHTGGVFCADAGLGNHVSH